MWTRQDKFRKSTLDTHKSETIGPKKGPVDFWPEVGYWEGQNSIPSFTQHEERFNKKYPALKPLPIMEQIKNRYDPHKSAPNAMFNDIAWTAAIAMPAGRAEEVVAALANKMMPALEKAWPKVMAKFADLLKKSKGNPKALESIYTKFNKLDDKLFEMGQDAIKWTNPFVSKYVEPWFTSRPVGELKGKAKIDAWLKSKPAYERKNMWKIIEADRDPGDFIGAEKLNRYDPKEHAKEMKWLLDESIKNIAVFQWF